jgi:hypothetical protein
MLAPGKMPVAPGLRRDASRCRILQTSREIIRIWPLVASAHTRVVNVLKSVHGCSTKARRSM